MGVLFLLLLSFFFFFKKKMFFCLFWGAFGMFLRCFHISFCVSFFFWWGGRGCLFWGDFEWHGLLCFSVFSRDFLVCHIVIIQ